MDEIDLEYYRANLATTREHVLLMLEGKVPMCPIILLSCLAAVGAVGDKEVAAAAKAHPEVCAAALACIDLTVHDLEEATMEQYFNLWLASLYLPPEAEEWINAQTEFLLTSTE